ncbi:unnamed protein product [Citrullus colocynthis]|uniref:Uncharacterized protein n=1 Tax=Citrullus colocynthis TaxID=252529 RepID=A0ABP0YFT5_9ROSI
MVTVVSGGIKNAPWMACKLVKNKNNEDSASVEDEPMLTASVEKQTEREEYERLMPLIWQKVGWISITVFIIVVIVLTSLHNAWLFISVVIANLFAVGGFWVLQAHAIFMNDPRACGAKPCISLVVEDIEPVDLVLSSPYEAAVKQRRPQEVGSKLERVALSKRKDMES